MTRSRFEHAITGDEFEVHVEPLNGLAVSRPWRGHGTALFLELGVLRELPRVRIRPNSEGDSTHQGEATVMIEWSWRVERLHSIAFGSWSTDRRIDLGISKLKGRHVERIWLEGRLPELVLTLSDRLWVHAFSTVEAQPQWTVFLPDGSWISVHRGRLQRNTQNITR